MASPLAHKLISLRKWLDVSQAAFGAPIGLAGTHVSIIEQGKRYAPPLANLLSLIGAFSLSSEEIQQLSEAADQSPRYVRIPPSAPADAFRFAAKLTARFNSMQSEDFERLSDYIESLSRKNFDEKNKGDTMNTS